MFKWLVGAGELLHIGELLCGRDWLSPDCPSISESLTPDGVSYHGRESPALLVLPGWRRNGREFVPALASYCKVRSDQMDIFSPLTFYYYFYYAPAPHANCFVLVPTGGNSGEVVEIFRLAPLECRVISGRRVESQTSDLVAEEPALE